MDDDINKQPILEDANQLMMLNWYPACPQPQLTLGLPPHSDYGLLTLLLQDQVEGLQIQHKSRWLTVKPIPNSFVVNIGDQFQVLKLNHFYFDIFKEALRRE